MYKVKSPKNYRYPEDAYLELSGVKIMPSMTVPDQSFTVRQIMDKYTRGQSISGMGSYTEFDPEGSTPDDYIPHPKTLDLVDRQELSSKYRQELTEHSNKLKQNAQKPTLPDDGKPTV